MGEWMDGLVGSNVEGRIISEGFGNPIFLMDTCLPGWIGEWTDEWMDGGIKKGDLSHRMGGWLDEWEDGGFDAEKLERLPWGGEDINHECWQFLTEYILPPPPHSSMAVNNWILKVFPSCSLFFIIIILQLFISLSIFSTVHQSFVCMKCRWPGTPWAWPDTLVLEPYGTKLRGRAVRSEQGEMVFEALQNVPLTHMQKIASQAGMKGLCQTPDVCEWHWALHSSICG